MIDRTRAVIYARVSTRDQDPEMQLLDLRRYANERGFEIYHEFVDVGISGTKDSRLVEALYEFGNLGIDFISYQEAIDTSSPMGEAMFTIISAMAQLERDIIAERVRGGLRHAKERGKRLGRPRAEANSKEIIRLRGEGLSFTEIAARVWYTDYNIFPRHKHTGF